MNNLSKNVLVVDDNLTICLMLKSWLVKKGFNVETAISVADAKTIVKEQPFDLILCDIRMPDSDGFSFLSWVKKYDSEVLVIMMTGYADIESAVESMKSGAADYISKPIEPEQLFKKIEEAFTIHDNMLKQSRFSDNFIKFPSDEYKLLYEQLDATAEKNEHRLIIGDRGTGKRSTVKYIYEKGIHLSKPLVVFDIDKSEGNLVTQNDRTYLDEGRSLLMRNFFKAKGGLLYIRHLDLLDINLQDELLNILTKQNKDDDFTQIIMSTDVSKENLQRRLIPKLNNLITSDSIVLPTLNGKKEVILFLAYHFLRFANFTLDKQIESIDTEIEKILVSHNWPGNIQELKHCIIKAALLTEGSCISASIASELLDREGGKDAKKNALNIQASPIHGLRKENYEKEKIMEALELAKGNKTMAASILNIDRKTLYNKIKLYNVITNN